MKGVSRPTHTESAPRRFDQRQLKMKRLALLGSWKRLGIQAGLLAGLGLAFVGGSEPPAMANDSCPVEGDCSFKKPNFMIIIDYSSSMNIDWIPNQQTRWEAAVEAVQNIVTANNGYFDDNAHIAMMRYCHDPDPNNSGTPIMGDQSGLIDGVRLDVNWYDPNPQTSNDYFECNGDAIVQTLNQMPPPPCLGANCAGCGTWTNGAMLYAQELIEQSRADHPEDMEPGDERYYANLLLTDGVWCSQNGLQCADTHPAIQNGPDNPAPTAAHLYDEMGVPTYVVAIGEAVGTQFNDEIATAGGTGQALEPGQGQLIPALQAVVDDIINSVITPTCVGGMPRIMVVLDASSSMLNTGNGCESPPYAGCGPGAQGQTGWDQAFQALTGANGLFVTQVDLGGTQTIWGTTPKVEDLSHMGITVYGALNEEAILVNYGPCMRDNWEWALDPNTSCGAGCNDPWGGPPITWTFLTSPPTVGPHGHPFDQETRSHMPQCGDFGYPICAGSGTYVHRGLELAASNIAAYQANPPALYPLNENTRFINIHITDGVYNSTNQQVENALVGMYNQGVTTYTIGFGNLTQGGQLANMACWGSGGTGIPCQGGTYPYFDANNQQDLEAALQTIIETIDFDPCCAFNDCEYVPEPSTSQPDPVPGGESISAGEESGSTGDESPLTTGPSEDTTGGEQPTTGDPDATAEGGQEESEGDATATNATNATNVTVTAGEESGGETGGDSAGGTEGSDGCGCTTGNDDPRGLLGMLFLLGLGTAARRRRSRQ